MKKNNLKAWLYLLPAILFLGVFMVYPLIDVCIYAVEESHDPVTGLVNSIGLGNFRKVLQDNQFIQALGNTFMLVIITVPISTGLSLLIALGLSSVKLVRLEKRAGLGTVLVVSGADLMDGSPIYDIKPYLSFTDSHPDAQNGFAEDHVEERLPVEFPAELLDRIPEEKRPALLASLSLDPRPGYLTGRSDPYGFPYAGKDVRFYVEGGVVKVFDVVAP